MNHKIVSFYHSNLNREIVEYQKKVFDKLGIPLEQVEFSGSHGNAINDYLDNNQWDVITIFDVDCIPLDVDVVNKAARLVDDTTIYGNAQVSNSKPYAAPSFLTFTRNLYETSTHKRFDGMYHRDDNGNYLEADCAEVFSVENIRRGNKVLLSYPIEAKIHMWKYSGDSDHPAFSYGTGTVFDNNTYHNFQIRLGEVQSIFINYVKAFLNE